jgi:hypothetical protein
MGTRRFAVSSVNRSAVQSVGYRSRRADLHPKACREF